VQVVVGNSGVSSVLVEQKPNVGSTSTVTILRSSLFTVSTVSTVVNVTVLLILSSSISTVDVSSSGGVTFWLSTITSCIV